MSKVFENVYRWIIPKPIKKMVWSYVCSIEKQRRMHESESFPYHELQSKHIEHATLLLNRQDLLECFPKRAIVAEVGVDEGVFTEQILATCKPAKLHLIDIWASERYHPGKASVVERKFHDQIRDGVVEINIGYSMDVLRNFEDEYFDWIYIDSAHTYSTTAEELKLARRKVKPGGIISGHDYVTGNWDSGYRYGVVEAVHEFCVKENWEILYLTTETHQHRSFALRAINHNP